MKRYKKLLAFVLALVLAFGSSITTFAEEIDLSGETESFEIEEYSEDESAIGAIYDEPEEELVIEEESEEESEGETQDIQPPVEENEDEPVEDTEIEGSFPGVDIVGFCSDPEIIEDKEELADSLGEFETSTADKDYAEGEIIVEAPDEETAVKYAEGFGGKMAAFDYGYALILLDTDDENGDGYSLTVDEAVHMSAREDVPLPAAWPNYYAEYTSDAGEEISDDISYYEPEYVSDTNPDYDLGLMEYESVYYNDNYLKSTSQYYQYQHALLQTEAAWRAGYTGKGVKVAVLDSGINKTHEDLKDAIKGTGVYNASTHKFAASSDITDSNSVGHGTHCSGIVAARHNNGVGGAGIAPECSLYAGCVNDSEGSLQMWNLRTSISYAVHTWKVDVISISMGVYYRCPALDDAVEDAYMNGVALFTSAGNFASNRPDYLASAKYAITVGAVNASNSKVYFSDQNSHVRYSGPGYQIYSTTNTGDSAYIFLDGTSQACPSIAGVAAVILSSGRVAKDSSRPWKRVDNLLAIMDKSTTKSGIGKGTPNLAKALGLNTYATAPLAPVSSLKSGVISTQTKTVTLESSVGTTIYYDAKGGNITYKNGKISANATKMSSNKGTVTLSALDGGKQVLKAVAIDNYTKLCSKVATYTYTFKPQVSEITVGSKTSDFFVAKGSSLQLTATVKPACAANKTVKWSLTSTYNGVSINEKTGKLTVDKTVSSYLTTVNVKAKATDGSNISSASTAITIVQTPQVKSVTASSRSVQVYSEKSDSSISLKTINTSGNQINSQNYLSVLSSNSGIATASLSTNKLTINGIAPGKATITCYSKDGTYKKVTITVNVLQKVTSIDVLSPGSIVQGGTFNQSVTVSPANASNKGVKWSLISFPSGCDAKNCGVSINAKSGQIRATKNAKTGSYTAKYEAADGKGAGSTFSFTIKSYDTRIKSLSINTTNVRLFRVGNGYGAQTTYMVAPIVSGGSKTSLKVTSNAEGIAKAELLSSGNVKISATGNATGTAKITVCTTDGTNIKKDIKVTVVNPPSSLAISLPAGRCELLGYGKSMKLIPTFFTEKGPIDAVSKKLTWTSSNTNLVTVSSNGTVKTVGRFFVPSGSNSVTITARTTDGSGLSATYTIVPNTRIVRISAVSTGTGTTGDALFDNIVLQLAPEYSPTGGLGMYSYTFSGDPNGCMVIQKAAGQYQVLFFKKGNYSVTFRLLDGSNKTTTCRWRIY